jgi:GNAT superfamily N-acetyltransferase
LDLLWEIQKEADRWMRAKGHAPLGALYPEEERRAFMARNLREAEVFFFEEAGAPWGCLRLQREDTTFWGEAGKDGRAGYIHGLVVRDGWHGCGRGLEMLAWAEERIRSWGGSLARLDCKADNARLRRYYREAGYAELGETRLDNGWMAARFEKRLKGEEGSHG